MSLDILKQKSFSTASSAILGLISRTTPTSFQYHISSILSGIPTEKTIHAFIPKMQERKEIEEADDEEVMKAFLEIEPRYSNLYRKLAEL